MSYSASTSRYDTRPNRAESAGALSTRRFSVDEIQVLDPHAVDDGINLWQRRSTDQRP